MLPLELVFDDSDSQVMTARAENRILNFLCGPQQTHVEFLAGIDSFHETRDAQQPICVHHSGDHSGSPRQRHRN